LQAIHHQGVKKTWRQLEALPDFVEDGSDQELRNLRAFQLIPCQPSFHTFYDEFSNGVNDIINRYGILEVNL